jgi:hypothetical protein
MTGGAKLGAFIYFTKVTCKKGPGVACKTKKPAGRAGFIFNF